MAKTVEDAVEVAKAGHESVGQRFDIAAGNGAEQDQFEQLILGHRSSPSGHETGAQALAVIGDIGGLFASYRCCGESFVH